MAPNGYCLRIAASCTCGCCGGVTRTAGGTGSGPSSGCGFICPVVTRRKVRDFRSMPGALRVLGTVQVTGHRYGPAGLLLCWPLYGGDSALHVLSSDAPSVRTLWEFRQLAAVERGFRDDKSGCFGLERVRLTSPERLERLLFGIAVAELFLKSLATRALLQGAGHEVDAHREVGHGLLQMGARYLRRSLWRGVTPPLTLGLAPDAPVAGRSDVRVGSAMTTVPPAARSS